MNALAELVRNAATENSSAIIALGVIVKVTLLLVVAACATVALRRASAATRHHVWLLAIGATLVVPMLAFAPGGTIRLPAGLMSFQSKLFSLRQSPASSASTKPERVAEYVSSPSNRQSAIPSRWPLRASSSLGAHAGVFFPSPKPTTRVFKLRDGTVVFAAPRVVPEGMFPATPEPSQKKSTNVWMIVGALWLAGAIVLIGWRAVGYLWLERLVKRSTPVSDATWQEALQSIAAEFGITRTVRLFEHQSFRTPVTAGWRHPVIVLPAELGATSPDRQHAILAHELAHIQRFDFAAQQLAAIATSLFWFHPLVWFATARLRAESERAADDCVLARGVNANDYGHHLLALADRSRFVAVSARPVLGMARMSQLEQRLRAMMNAKISRRALSRGARNWTALASVTIVVPVASLRVAVAGEHQVRNNVPFAERSLDVEPVVPPGHTEPLPDRQSSVDSTTERSSRARVVEEMRAASAAVSTFVVAMQETAQRAAIAYPANSGETIPIHLEPGISNIRAMASPNAMRSDTVIEQTVPMNDGELLTLSVFSGANIVVKGWDNPSAKMRATLGGTSWPQAHAQLSRGPDGVGVSSVSEREGFRISESTRPRGWTVAVQMIPGPLPIPPSVDHLLEIWVPRHTNIKLFSVLGRVTIQDVEGAITGEAKTGDIEITNAKGSANVTAEFGDLRVANSTLTGEAVTQCGSVTVAQVTGDFKASSKFDPAPFGNSGKIIIIDGVIASDYCIPRLRGMSELPNRVSENNPYGDIVLDAAPTGGALSTGRSGSIVVRASGGHISAATSRGNIELSNVRGDATARSSGGDITIRLVNTDGAEHYVNARTTNGNVVIEIPDELDARINAVIVTTDSARAKGRYAGIIDQYGLNDGAKAGQSRKLATGETGSSTATIGLTLGRGTGRIDVHVTDGDIIFRRAKR